MSARYIIALGLMLFFQPVALHAQNTDQNVTVTAIRSLFDAQNARIDELANSSREERLQLRGDLRALQERVDGFQEIESDLQGLEERVLENGDLNQRLREAITSSEQLRTVIEAIQDNTEDALTRAQDAQSSASSTAWILTVVSTIVSILVIIIGLFFSSRFMQLHAENQVSKALLERIEKEIRSRDSA